MTNRLLKMEGEGAECRILPKVTRRGLADGTEGIFLVFLFLHSL